MHSWPAGEGKAEIRTRVKNRDQGTDQVQDSGHGSVLREVGRQQRGRRERIPASPAAKILILVKAKKKIENAIDPNTRTRRVFITLTLLNPLLFVYSFPIRGKKL